MNREVVASLASPTELARSGKAKTRQKPSSGLNSNGADSAATNSPASSPSAPTSPISVAGSKGSSWRSMGLSMPTAITTAAAISLFGRKAIRSCASGIMMSWSSARRSAKASWRRWPAICLWRPTEATCVLLRGEMIEALRPEAPPPSRADARDTSPPLRGMEDTQSHMGAPILHPTEWGGGGTRSVTEGGSPLALTPRPDRQTWCRASPATPARLIHTPPSHQTDPSP